MSEEQCNDVGFSKKEDLFACDSCNFSNQSRMGMKRHVTLQHKEGGNSAKRSRPEDNDDSLSMDEKAEEKKTKTSDAYLEEHEESSESLESIMAKAKQFEFDDNEEENKSMDETLIPFSSSDLMYEQSVNLLAEETPKEIDNIKTDQLDKKIKDLELEVVKRNVIIDDKDRELYNRMCDIELFKNEANDKHEIILKKDETIEVILSEKNSLEEEIVTKNKEISDVQHYIKVINKRFTKIETENKKIKETLEKKNDNITNLQDEKKSLMKKITDLEVSKTSGVNKSNKTKVDDLQEEVKKLKTSSREMQLKLTDVLNKNAQLETLNARTMLQNKNLSELVKKSSTSETEPMEVDVDKAKESDVKAKAESTSVPKKKKIKKCRFVDRAKCRKGEECPFLHPSTVCVLFSHLGEGACPDGDACEKSHPVQVCEQWLQGNCTKNNKCKSQHPVTNNTQKRNVGGHYEEKRRGSQGQPSYGGQNQQEDLKYNFVQHQGLAGQQYAP